MAHLADMDLAFDVIMNENGSKMEHVWNIFI